MSRKLLRLFWEMFKIASLVVGGGFAIIAVADEVFSKKLKWTQEGEVVGSLPLFQMFPGIIAGNTAIYVGRKVAGAAGAAAALAGVFLPSVIIFSAVSAGYASIPLENRFLAAAFLGLRSALTGIIFAMLCRSWRKTVQGAYGYAVFAAALAATMLLKANAALVIATAAAFGIAAKTARKPPSASAAKFSSCWMIPLVFMKYGLLAFGGGYVLVPLYMGDFVGPSAPFLQLSAGEFADVMALTQMTPGPIAVNCATFFGYRMGLAGFDSNAAAVACAVLATFSLLLPGSILLYVALGSIDRFKESRVVQGILFGVRPVTSAMMASALWTFAGMSVWTAAEGTVSFSPAGAVLTAATAVLMILRKAGVVPLIFSCAAASAAVEALKHLMA